MHVYMVYMCRCMCICIYVDIYICVRICVGVCVGIYMGVYRWMGVDVGVYMYACVYTFEQMGIHVYTSGWTCIYRQIGGDTDTGTLQTRPNSVIHIHKYCYTTGTHIRTQDQATWRKETNNYTTHNQDGDVRPPDEGPNHLAKETQKLHNTQS